MTGIRVRAVWEGETEYATVPTTAIEDWKLFGHGMRLNVSRNNNSNFIIDLGSPYWGKQQPGRYDIRASISFVMSYEHISWLKYMMGKWESTEAGGVYTHTFQRNWTTGYSGWKNNESICLKYMKMNIPVGGTVDEVITLKGGVINTGRFSYETSTGRINVQLEILFADDEKTTEGGLVYKTPEGDIVTFSCVQVWDGSEWKNIARTDRAEISLNNNISPILGCSRKMEDYSVGQQRSEISTQCRAIDPTVYLDKMYGSATGAVKAGPTKIDKMRLISTNDQSGTDERTFVIELEDCYAHAIDYTFDPEQVIYDRPRITARKMNVIVKNASEGDGLTIASPTADAGIDQTSDVDATVTFDGSGSTTDDPNGLSFIWTFDDGGTQALTGVSPEYIFDSEGTYTVTLIVKDSYGQTDTDTMTVTVS